MDGILMNLNMVAMFSTGDDFVECTLYSNKIETAFNSTHAKPCKSNNRQESIETTKHNEKNKIIFMRWIKYYQINYTNICLVAPIEMIAWWQIQEKYQYGTSDGVYKKFIGGEARGSIIESVLG